MDEKYPKASCWKRRGYDYDYDDDDDDKDADDDDGANVTHQLLLHTAEQTIG